MFQMLPPPLSPLEDRGIWTKLRDTNVQKSDFWDFWILRRVGPGGFWGTRLYVFKGFFGGGCFPFRISLTFIKVDKLEGFKCSKF